MDIHNYEKRLNSALAKIEDSDICEENKKAITDFTNNLFVRGLSIARIEHYIHCIKIMSAIINKPFASMDKSDIMRVVGSIQRREWSKRYKGEFKVTLKIFFRWLKGSEEYPDMVRWIKVKHGIKKRLPEEILTEDEVIRMAEKADHPRDKAFLMTLYESGCRIGELLTIKIKNVQENQHGIALMVNGKTGSRRVLIISSAPLLARWLNIHPDKNDPEAFVWIGIGNRNKNRSLKYGSAVKVLQKMATLANVKKRVNPHAFRHARATHLANRLTEAQMKQYFGWVQGSDMATVYVHLSGRDVDNALLKMHGLSNGEEEMEEKMKVRSCPRCKEKNSPAQKFCGRCGSPIELRTALDIEKSRNDADDITHSVVKKLIELNPMIEKQILEVVDMMKMGERIKNIGKGRGR